MPEIAEVELTRRALEHLVGQRLRRVVVEDDLLRLDAQTIEKRVLTKLSRRGKYLLFHFSDMCLLMHMRMTGSLRSDDPGSRHRRLRLAFEHACVDLIDPRRFATAQVDTCAAQMKLLARKLGPDVWESGFEAHFTARAHARSAPIRNVMIDQKVGAGVGAWIAEEALHHARINGLRPACTLTEDELARLASSIRTQADKGLATGGMSMRDYVHPDGSRGHMQEHVKVYRRSQQPCLDCETGTVQHLRHGSAATYLCPICQPARP